MEVNVEFGLGRHAEPPNIHKVSLNYSTAFRSRQEATRFKKSVLTAHTEGPSSRIHRSSLVNLEWKLVTSHIGAAFGELLDRK